MTALSYGTGNPWETGTGTYNLNGGTLALAYALTANSAAEQATPVWKFNLGGGTLQATGNLTISSSSFFTLALTANGSTIDTQGNTLTINPHQRRYSLTKNGSGTLDLTTTNSFSSLAVNNGIVKVSSQYGLGGATGGITVASGAALQLSGISGAMSSAAPLTLNGTGISNGGALEMISGTTTWSGPITLASAARINSDSGTLTFSGSIAPSGYNLTIGGAGNTTISTSYANGEWVTKDGTGTLTCNSLYIGNVSTGTLTLLAGTLNATLENVSNGFTGAVAQSGGLNNVSGNLDVGASGGGTYSQSGGTNSVAAIETIGNGPGSSTYTLTSGSNNVATLIFGNNPSSGGTYNLNGGTLTVGSGGIAKGTQAGISATVNLAGGTLQAGASFTSTSAVSMTLSSTSTIDTQSYSPTISGTLSGSGSINKIGSGTLILTGTNGYSGLTTLSAGVLELGASARNPVFTGGGVDIRAGKVVFDYVAGADPAATIKALLAASYDGGLWNVGQFRSSSARATLGLGWTDNTVNDKVTVAYAFDGDTNLDGTVNGADLNTVLSNFNQTNSTWSQGDFDYNGTVNGADLNIVLSNFNQHLSVGAAVPEPCTLGMLALAALGLLVWNGGRRRK